MADLIQIVCFAISYLNVLHTEKLRLLSFQANIELSHRDYIIAAVTITES
jgi:hypothetical protein